uniref:Uncharacterized protein n=1 Tax=Anopheles dirus TaxID=7168 RepID=A0A182MXA6_9DIPT
YSGPALVCSVVAGPRHEGPRSSPANGSVRKELPENLSREALRREAEFVLAQADKIDRSRAPGTGASATNATDPLGAARFNSLPSRSKQRAKRVTRSSSDAASKKPAKSLLSLFGRKAAPPDEGTTTTTTGEAPSSRSTLGRSKSDVGSRNGPLVKQRKVPRRATQELGDLRAVGKKHDPLTPIIEASPLEYTHPVDPLTAHVRRGRAASEEPKASTRSAPKPGVMETITLLRSTGTAKSQDALHSSQLPPEKPHLTKGVTVENIVKRLSSERHTSPPPAQIVGGGFSYTRGPGEPVVYAQVVANEANTAKHTVKHQHYPSTEEEDPTSSGMWTTDSKMKSTGGFMGTTQRPSPPLPKYRLDEADHSTHTGNVLRRKLHTNSDEDEGLGIDYSRQQQQQQHQQRYSSSAYVHTSRTSPKSFLTNSDEDPPMAPSVVRVTPTEKNFTTSYSVHYRGQADGKEHLPEFHELSQRREILESRIRSRIGSRDLLDRMSPERSVPVPIQLTGSGAHRTSSTSKYRTSTTERRSVDRVLDRHDSPVRRSTLSPTPTFRESSQDRTEPPRRNSRGYVETFVTKTVVNRDGKPVSEEYVERYKYPGDNVEAVTSSRTVYDREGSAGRTEVQRFNRYVPEQGAASSYKRTVADKGDSGIENDFRKDSFNQEFITGTKFTLTENVRACEDFLRMERTHTNSCMRKPRKGHVYRERSIDDGSRYDPRLDEVSASRSYHRDTLKSSLKAEKKAGGLAKVKQFVSSTRKKLVRMGAESSDRRDHSGSLRSDGGDAARVPDIATRRRLSTPKSSPSSAKRSLSFKSSKLSASTAADGQKQASSRSDWFKSFDRLSRKKSSSKPNLSADGKAPPVPPPPPKQAKSLRFFGDTDTEYGDQNATSYRSARSNLSKTEKKYRSAYDLDTAPKMRDTARNRSSSLHNLDEEDELSLRGKDYRSVEQSSTFYRARSPSPSDYRQEQRVTTRDYTPERVARKAYHHQRSRENGIDLVDAERSQTPSVHHQRPGSRSRSEHKKPPSGPQKPARAFERRDSLNRDIDRILDSSGTEGESSQQSQRSVVFLHATTVGDIPHPQIANARRRAYSRESLNHSVASSKKVQPMTRTVSRSISVLAPWKPKNIREGYEIDYHKDQHQSKPISTLPRSGAASRPSSTIGSQSTLSRPKHRSQPGRDDPDSDKSSTFEQSRRSSADAQQHRRSSGPRETGPGMATPYASTTLPSSRRMKDSIAQYPSRTSGSGSTLKYRR